jgi:hypothetical protein
MRFKNQRSTPLQQTCPSHRGLTSAAATDVVQNAPTARAADRRVHCVFNRHGAASNARALAFAARANTRQMLTLASVARPPSCLMRPLLLSATPPRVRRQTPDPASVTGVARVYRVFLNEKHCRDFATSSKLWRKGNWSFQVLSSKTPESRSQARQEGERTPNTSLPLKLHRLLKCANTTM